MGAIVFGTDGWRAVIAEDFTFDNLKKVAQATANVWQNQNPKSANQRVIVGYDRRFLSPEFAHKTAEVFSENGFEVVLSSSAVPTPAVSYHVKLAKAIGGVMITASHNPPKFNGFKIKSHFGGSADSAFCKKVELNLDKTPMIQSKAQIHVKDLMPSYLRALMKLVDFDRIAKSRLRLAHDALYGVGSGCFDKLLAGTNCRVTTLRGEHNPSFCGINPEPIAANYAQSSAFLKRHPHDICITTDGDADRIGGMDGLGNPLSTHQIICLLLRHFVENRQMKGRIVKAISTTSMVDKMCKHYDLTLLETGVGFKHICAEMLKGDVMLGFEESGGIGFSGHLPERDGILAGLILLEMLSIEKIPLSKLIVNLENDFGKHRYARRDLRLDADFSNERKIEMMQHCAVHPPKALLGSPIESIQSFDGVKYIARNGAWLMLRASGTEPILRIYAEANSDANAQRLLELGQSIMKNIS